jgi:hypothetical protein
MNFNEIDEWLAEAAALIQRGEKKAYESRLIKIFQEAFPGKSSWKTISGLSRQYEKARDSMGAKPPPPTDPKAQALTSAETMLQNALFPFARRMEPLVRRLVFRSLFEVANAPGLPPEMHDWNADAKGALIADIGTSLQFIVLRLVRRFQSLWREAVRETHTKEERDYFKQYQFLWDKYEVLAHVYDQVLIMHRLCDPEMIYQGSNLKLLEAEWTRREAHGWSRKRPSTRSSFHSQSRDQPGPVSQAQSRRLFC